MTGVLATRSAGKLRELRPLFASAGVDVVALHEIGVAESPVEDALEIGETFEENALAKARHFARVTGRVAFADDSGLVVDALGGAPGVRSKRWSGRTDLDGAALDAANNALLLERLAAAAVAGVEDRGARYVCAAAVALPEGWEVPATWRLPAGARELVARGEVSGRITRDARGGGGFGYDPYFACDELGGRTFAEVGVDEKGRVSHRGRAFRALLSALLGASVGGRAAASAGGSRSG